MKTNLTITIKGECSEPKNELAESIKQFLKDRGYGEVLVSGSSDDEPYDGLLSFESVRIEIR